MALAPLAPPPSAARSGLAELLTSAHLLEADRPIGELVRIFERQPEIDSVAVVDGGRLRIVVRARFFLQLGKRFGYSLYENRPARLLSEEASTVEVDSDPVEVISLALEREPGRIYDDLLVVHEGRYVGTLAMRSLMAHHKDLLRASMAELSELDQRNRQLAELNRLQAEFLANMTHELRSPLNAILGAAGVLAGSLTMGNEARQVELVERRARDLLRLIDDMLDLSKLEAGRLQALVEPVDVEALLTELAQSSESQLAGRPVRMLLRLTGAPRSFVTDPVFVRRIVENLVGNAVKFTETGSITLGCSSDGPWLTLQVADTGPGIRAEDLPRLFTRFTQLESTRTKRHAGTGLGLAIVKGLAEQLSGRVSVESRAGEGSTFTVHLPDARLFALQGARP